MFKHARPQRGVNFAVDPSHSATGKTSSPPTIKIKLRRPVDEDSIGTDESAAIGGKARTAFILKHRDTIFNLARRGIRKPDDVSSTLNSMKIRTADGRNWTPGSAFWLLHFLFKLESKSKPSAKISTPSAGKSSNAKRDTSVRKPTTEKPRKDDHQKPGRTQLTAEERSRRLAALAKAIS